MRKILLYLALGLPALGVRAQTTLVTESFETDGEGSRYTSNSFDLRASTSLPAPNTNGQIQYFTRNYNNNPVINPFTPTNASFGTNAKPLGLSNVDGLGFWIAEGVVGSATRAGSAPLRPPGYVRLNGIATTGYSNLTVTLRLADPRGPSGNGMGSPENVRQWEEDDFVRVQYSFDDVTYFTIGTFQGDNHAAGLPAGYLSLNGDGTVAANTLTPSLTDFTFSVPGTGTTLYVRVQDDHCGGLEELAFDKIIVSGTSSTTQRPVVTNPDNSVLAYTEGQTPAALPVLASLSVTDADSPILTSATVQVATGYVLGQDVLGYTTGNGITGAFNATTGVLTLTGPATPAAFQAALRTVTYQNTNTVTATGGSRVVQVTANDGTGDSGAASRTVTVTAILDGPVGLPYREDFDTDGEGLRYSSNQFGVPNSSLAFTRTNVNPFDGTSATTFSNISNGYYWFGENTSSFANPDPARVGRFTTQQIDARNYGSLHFQLLLGASNVGSRIQTTDYFKLSYRTGGSTGAWTLFGSFRGDGVGASAAGVMRQDADPANPGPVPTGLALAPGLQNVDFTLPPGVDNQLVEFQLELNIDDAVSDFAFDNLRVTGTFNNAPTLATQTFSLPENAPNGTLAGPVAATDPDAGQTLTYAITAGNTGGAFAFVGNQLRVANVAALDYETTPTFALSVQVTDNGRPNRSSAPATITVNLTDVDEIPPVVSSVAVPANGTYITGQVLSFTVNFSESVLVNTAGGTPTLPLTVGTAPVAATYVSGSGTNSLLFRYTVQSGDADPDGVALAGSMALNGSTLRDAAGNNAILTLAGVPNTTGVLVDAVAPDTNILSGPAASSTSASATFSFGSTKAGSSFEASLDGGPYTSVTNPQTYTGQADGAHSLAVRARDAVGNLDASPATYAWNIDTTSPTDLALSSLSVPENKPAGTAVGTFTPTAPTAGQPYSYTLVPGAGSADNASFSVVGNELRTAAVLSTTTQSSYAVRVRVQNARNQTLEKAFTIALTSNPLPVELAAFLAERRGEDALLRWTTASEKNNEHFDVESSLDGQSFQRIGTVAGQGSNTQRHDYELTDHRLARYAAGLVYYRLRQVDRDGTFSYSPVRMVQVPQDSGFTVQAYPQPFGTKLSLLLRTAEAGTVTIVLHDAVGRVLLTRIATLQSGSNVVALPEAAALPSGIYVLSIVHNTYHRTVKFVRE